MRRILFIALFSTLFTSLVAVAQPEEDSLAARSAMAEQFMNSFCFGNSWPAGVTVTDGENDNRKFSAMVTKDDNSVVRRVFLISNKELHDMQLASYVKHLTNEDLTALLSFCNDDNIALKSALVKKSEVLRNKKILAGLNAQKDMLPPDMRPLASLIASIPPTPERALSEKEEAAYAAFIKSEEMKNATSKIKNEIFPEIRKSIWDIGKTANMETDLFTGKEISKDKIYKATNFAKIGDENAIPKLNDAGRAGYRNWLGKPFPRAFVVAEDGAWVSTWGTLPSDESESKDPVTRAIERCQKHDHKNCKPYAIDNRVVWGTPGQANIKVKVLTLEDTP